jgi:GTP-binding protein
MFVDEITLICRGGDGGNGCMSFRKEAHVPRGGPDGGDGGHGGKVILEADENLTNLAHLIGCNHQQAGRGEHGMGKRMTGSQGDDVVVPVPCGTLVFDAERGNLLRDLSQHGERLQVARGGKGGRGNFRFMSSVNRAPREHERGQPGTERKVRLELKVIADVGLVGKPNAGKSTLLSRLTRATPEIASYPFTTKYPNLGMFRLGYDQAFVIADIPGLIEGAHAGVGLGHDFLKHVERTKVFLHLVEPEPQDETDPIQNYHAIREELRLYNETLAARPELIVVTKCELPKADEVANELAAATGLPVLKISAVTGKGLPELTREIVSMMNRVGSKDPEWKPPVTRRE